MINEENLRKLYDGILEGKDLTTKQLNEYGFSSKDLKELTEEGKIERIKRGLYTLKNVNDLFYYGKKTIAENNYEKATMIFEKCFMLDKTHLGACFQLFLRSVQNEDYKRAFELYDCLEQTPNQFYKVDMNYYLYLLSIITEVPEKYREYARNLKFNDIKISYLDKRYEDIYSQNKIRSAALQRSFTHAVVSLNGLIRNHNNLTVQDIITKTLLFQAKNAETISRNTINSLIKEKRYNDASIHLLNKQEKHNLSVLEDYTLKLIKTFMEMKETKIIPKNKALNVRTMFDAIDANNYTEALRLNREYNQKYNIDNDKNAITLLLNDICNLIDELSKTEEIVTENKREVKEEIKTLVNPVNKEISSFSSVISFLMKNDLDNALNSLKQYMKSINKTEYEFLIINLIKLSLLEQDLAFTKPMLTLTLMSKEIYSFDISNYIQEFYMALSQNKLKEARIYLDIISKANKLGQDSIETDRLYQVLEISEKAKNYKKDNSVVKSLEKTTKYSSKEEKTVKLIQSVEPKVVVTKTVEPEISFSKRLMQSATKNNEFSQEKRETEKKFIAKKHEELIEKRGIILLKPMDDTRAHEIIDIVKEYPDMVASIIGEGNKKQVVLRYYNVGLVDVDIKTFINLGNQAYKEENYDECIKNYLQLLEFVNKPRAVAYSKLGLSYMKKWDIPHAIDYLTVANAVSKQEGTNFDFSDLILRLKGDITKKEAKPKFEMKQTEFNYNDVNDYYGIENFDEINENIIKSGLDIETYCEQINLSKEQIDIIKLIYAREFYTQGNIKNGDIFLKLFEKSKNKTQKTIQLSEEIRKNKMFYQNRQETKFKQLALLFKKKQSS